MTAHLHVLVVGFAAFHFSQLLSEVFLHRVGDLKSFFRSAELNHYQ